VSAIAPDDAYWPGAWFIQVESDLGTYRLLVGGEPPSTAVQRQDIITLTVCRPAP